MINQNVVRKVDMPANLFSNLGGKDYSIPTPVNNIVKTNNELAEDMKEYYESGDIKLNNLSNQKNYRDRLNKIYENLKGLNPIDTEIKDTIFTSNYIEKGIVIKPTIQELKQFWTEYRLMHNEKKTEEEKLYTEPVFLYNNATPSEFDELFDKLTKRVDEINLYIDELKKMRTSVEKNNEQIAKGMQELEEERTKFLNYKQEEEEKIRKEKENLKVNFNRLKTIVDSLDVKLSEVE